MNDYFDHYLRDGEVARFTIQSSPNSNGLGRPSINTGGGGLIDDEDEDEDGINSNAFNYANIGPPSSVSTKSDWEEIRSPQPAPTVDVDGRSEAYGSTFWHGLDEAFLPSNARLYDTEGGRVPAGGGPSSNAGIMANLQAVRANPDILMDVSRMLSPRSTATLIHFLDDSDDSEFELPARPPPPQQPRKAPSPPKGILSPKGKAREFPKEVAFDKHLATPGNNNRPSSSQSMRGSAADPRDIQVPPPSVLPEVAAVPEVVATPHIINIDPASIPPITRTPAGTHSAYETDPPIPTVPAPAPATGPNVVSDIASLITAFQTALLTQPDLGAGLRHFIRSAVAGSPVQSIDDSANNGNGRSAGVSRGHTPAPPSEAPTETQNPAQLRNVIRTLKESIAAQSAAGDWDDDYTERDHPHLHQHNQ